MKKVFYLVFGCLWAVIGVVFCKAQFAEAANAVESCDPTYYPAVGEVVRISEADDEVFIKTHDGREWSFKGVEDWAVRDKCCMVFSDNGTSEYIDDDQIINARYFV